MTFCNSLLLHNLKGRITMQGWVLITIVILFCNYSNVAVALTGSDRLQAINSYNNAFYHELNSDVGYYYVQNGQGIPDTGHFWQTCETIEVLEDAYRRTRDPIYRGMITKLVNGLNRVVSKNGDSNWASWNGFNDDIMWGVIALVRAYELTGKTNQAFLDQAQIQFNLVWSRGWDLTVGGGLWQTTEKKSKNACVNFPAIIAAMFLARNTHNTGFRAQANQLWTWSRDHLYLKATGRVIDNVNAAGEASSIPAFTYNQGSFIGAAFMLYLDTRKSGYLRDCARAATFAKNSMTTSDILDNHETGGPDGPGFKGIFARWCSKYANQANDEVIKRWLTRNADKAWSNRNSANLVGTEWQNRTPDVGDLPSWSCSGALSIIVNAP
ncbi:hypothetical protein M758_12G129600 [Ceratodon purpureus]|nr:hypothetical protein M758_12G129600 [Ceratodon purpureus]